MSRPAAPPPGSRGAEPRSLRYHDLAGSRPQPAGRVLVIGLLALVLAALLNADGLAEMATRQPVGWKRDVALVGVTPFCTLGRVTRLTDARRAIRDATDKTTRACDDHRSGADSFVAPPTTTTDPSPTGTTAPAVTRRVPTAADPLRIWLGGDSTTIELASATEQSVASSPEVDLTTRPEVSSGLTRPDFFDWPAYFAEDVLPTDPEVVVVMFGANDSQAVEVDGTVRRPSSPEWQAEYRRRVGVVMDQLRGDGRLVVWVGQPHMRDDGFDRRMGVLDEIYAEGADSRPWVTFLDSRPVLSPDQDGYQGIDADGTSLRQSDGIHLDLGGAALLADAILDVVDTEVIAPAPPR